MALVATIGPAAATEPIGAGTSQPPPEVVEPPFAPLPGDSNDDVATTDDAEPDPMPDPDGRPGPPASGAERPGPTAESSRTLGQPNSYLHDPLTGWHLVFVDGVLRAFDDSGRQVAARDIGIDFGQLVLDGDLFVQGPLVVVEVDRRTLAPLATYPLEGQPHLIGDELWALLWDRWTVIDRSTQQVRDVAGPLGLSSRHVPAFGSRILVVTNTGLSMVDVGVDPPQVVVELPGSGLWSVARDGTILTSEAPGVVTRRGPDLSIIDTTPIEELGAGFVVWAEDAELFVTSTSERLALRRPGTGAVVATMPRPRTPEEIGAVLPDGALVRVDGRGRATRLPFAPIIERTTAAAFRPAWAPTLTVFGSAFEAVTEARVAGVAVPFVARRPGALQLDVSGLSGTGPAEVVLSSPFGEGRFTIPATPPRGSALLTIRSTSLGAPDVPTGWLVRCDDWRLRGSQLPDTVDVVTVPSLEECSVTFSGGPASGIRSGRVVVDEPGAPMVPIFGDSTYFISGVPAHVGAIVRDPAEPRIIGLAAVARGGAPPGATARFSIRCRDWTTEVAVDSSLPVAVEVPADVPTRSRCRIAIVDGGGARRAIHAVIREGESERFEGGDSIAFSLRSVLGNAFVLFFLDHGRSDLASPIVVAEPGAAVRGHRGAGSVRVVATRADGAPDPTATSSLVQAGSGGRPGAGDRFGAAVAVGDFDGDGRPDIAVGAPGDAVGGRRGAGVVQVFVGSDRGFAARRVVTLDRSTAGAGRPGRADGFGAALAVVDFDGDGIDDLAVGVPGAAVGPARAAGEVLVFRGTPEGLERRAADRFTQADMPRERPERGDRFGAALAGARGYLAVGAPGESIGRHRGAGIAHRIDGLSLEAVTLRAPSSSGDRHGTAVDVDAEGRVLVGAPGRDLAGSITLHVRDRGIWGARVVAQSDLRSRLSAPGNRFGESVAFVGPPDDFDILVGAPGTDFDGEVDAGVVHVLRLARQPVERGLIFSSFVGLDRVSPPDTEFGSTLSSDRLGRIVVGVPTGGPRGSGAVAVYAGRWYLLHDGLPRWGAPRPGDDFGAAVAG